eukprot:g35318.t1
MFFRPSLSHLGFVLLVAGEDRAPPGAAYNITNSALPSRRGSAPVGVGRTFWNDVLSGEGGLLTFRSGVGPTEGRPALRTYRAALRRPGKSGSEWDGGQQGGTGQEAGSLTHVDAQGAAVMVDIGGKPDTQRTAQARAVVRLGEQAFRLLRAERLRKGDALAAARLAGIGGAKLTAQLIPLCHPIGLHWADVRLELDEARWAAVVTATCGTRGKTGVEMEALVAASVAALTIYDMCKSVTHDIVIEEVKLLSKTGAGGREIQGNASPRVQMRDSRNVGWRVGEVAVEEGGIRGLGREKLPTPPMEGLILKICGKDPHNMYVEIPSHWSEIRVEYCSQ